jgi:tungstate transport system ATP-binding protein
VAAALSLVGLAAERFAERKWFQLSGGEAQRVSLAARLALRPAVLLLDEPTASVDAASAELIKTAVLRARDQWGTTLVIATHDRQWLHEICDESLHLFRGRILEGGADNLLFGPWQPGPDGFYHKPLAGGGLLRVPPPPHDQAVGVLDGEAVSLAVPGGASQPGLNTMEGVVSRLVLEKHTRLIVATISAGLLALTVKLDVERVQALKLYPGQAVRVDFAPEAVAWCDPA